jgi:hypothetical protein
VTDIIFKGRTENFSGSEGSQAVLARPSGRGKFGTSRLGKLLLALVSTVFLGFESSGTHDRILLSHDSGIVEPSLSFETEFLLNNI